MKKETRGGKRSGSGRPKIPDKKQTINLYLRKSTIDFHGGKIELINKITKKFEVKPKK